MAIVADFPLRPHEVEADQKISAFLETWRSEHGFSDPDHQPSWTEEHLHSLQQGLARIGYTMMNDGTITIPPPQ